MHLARLQIAQRGMESDVVVLVDESRHDPLRLQVVVAEKVVAVLTDGAVEALDDAVGFRMARSRANVEQVVRLDDRAQLGVAKLAAMVVHDAWPGTVASSQCGLQLDGDCAARKLRQQSVMHDVAAEGIDKGQQEVVTAADPDVHHVGVPC